MRVSAIYLAGLAAIALAAPIEVSTELSERQYEPIEKQIKEVNVEKRIYTPTSLIHESLEGKETE
ncbi:hypothetical protein M426DRAFT_326184 [Hypoxylon sp. CI-4A]|nr:hypothetical protein M426DRAFT_326184 [Hypoxylon sp. CI-4A]